MAKRMYLSPGNLRPKPRNDWIMGESANTGMVPASEIQNRFRKSWIIRAWWEACLCFIRYS